MRAWRRRERAYAAPFAIEGAMIEALDLGREHGRTVQRVRAAVREMNCSVDRDLVLVALGEEPATPEPRTCADFRQACPGEYCDRPCGQARPEPIDVICAALGHEHAGPWPCGDAFAIVSDLADHGWVITSDADGSEDVRSAVLRAAADEWDRINAGPDFSELKAIAEHYSPGLALTSIWLRILAGEGFPERLG